MRGVPGGAAPLGCYSALPNLQITVRSFCFHTVATASGSDIEVNFSNPLLTSLYSSAIMTNSQ
jgi:hypothetical protein